MKRQRQAKRLEDAVHQSGCHRQRRMCTARCRAPERVPRLVVEPIEERVQAMLALHSRPAGGSLVSHRLTPAPKPKPKPKPKPSGISATASLSRGAVHTRYFVARWLHRRTFARVRRGEPSPLVHAQVGAQDYKQQLAAATPAGRNVGLSDALEVRIVGVHHELVAHHGEEAHCHSHRAY